MAFTLTTTFGRLFPFQMSSEAKLFSSPETVDIRLTQQHINRNENESNGIEHQIWESHRNAPQNARKRPQTERNTNGSC